MSEEEIIDIVKTEITNSYAERKAKALQGLLELYNKGKEEKERYKRLAEANLKDSEEFRKNECEHRCIKHNEVLELKEELNKEKEKNLKQFAEIENLKYTMSNMKHIDTINKYYISKDKIRELKEFYIKDCENKNIDLIPLENLIKNIDHLGINI